MSRRTVRVKNEQRAAVEARITDKNCTIRDIADAVNMNPATVSSFLAWRGIDHLNFQKICRFLDLNSVEIGEPTKNNKSDCSSILRNSYFPSEFNHFIHERTTDFVGRGFVFNEINDFLTRKDSGYFVLIGEPGQGKSSILCRYALDCLQENNLKCIVHFNSREGGRNTAKRFLESVCRQLILLFDLKDISAPHDPYEDDTFLSILLNHASEKLGEKDKLLIIVDALDEVDLTKQASFSNILYLPKILSRKTYFIVSRRPFSRNDERLFVGNCSKTECDLRKNIEAGIEDIKEYIVRFINGKNSVGHEYAKQLKEWINSQNNLTQEEFVKLIAVDKSENNFMYVQYILPDIAEGKYISLAITELPQGLADYYRQHWLRMEMSNKERSKDKLKVIYTISKVKTSCSIQSLVSYTQCNREVIILVLDEWYQFFRIDEIGSEECFSIYHQSFNDFLFDQALELSKIDPTEIKKISKLIANSLGGDVF